MNATIVATGNVLQIRKMGDVRFFVLETETGSIDVKFGNELDDMMTSVENIQIGDTIEVIGRVYIAQSGLIQVSVKHWMFRESFDDFEIA